MSALRALLIAVRDDWYALDLARVREVLEPRVVTRVPGAPGAILGVINVRGDVVGVLDTAALLGLPGLGGEAIGAVAVVADADGGPVGLAASEAPMTEELEEDLGASALAAGVRRWKASVGPAVEIELGVLMAGLA